MSTADEKAFDITVGLTRQLITASIAMIVVVVLLQAIFRFFLSRLDLAILSLALAFELVSVVFGINTHGALTSAVNQKKSLEVTQLRSVRTPAMTQQVFFILGLAALVLELFLFEPNLISI